MQVYSGPGHEPGRDGPSHRPRLLSRTRPQRLGPDGLVRRAIDHGTLGAGDQRCAGPRQRPVGSRIHLLWRPSRTFRDTRDYFYIDLASPAKIEAWLDNIASGQDYTLALRRNDSVYSLVIYSGWPGNTSEHFVSEVLPAGRYYLQVFNQGGIGTTQPYHVRYIATP